MNIYIYSPIWKYWKGKADYFYLFYTLKTFELEIKKCISHYWLLFTGTMICRRQPPVSPRLLGHVQLHVVCQMFGFLWNRDGFFFFLLSGTFIFQPDAHGPTLSRASYPPHPPSLRPCSGVQRANLVMRSFWGRRNWWPSQLSCLSLTAWGQLFLLHSSM